MESPGFTIALVGTSIFGQPTALMANLQFAGDMNTIEYHMYIYIYTYLYIYIYISIYIYVYLYTLYYILWWYEHSLFSTILAGGISLNGCTPGSHRMGDIQKSLPNNWSCCVVSSPKISTMIFFTIENSNNNNNVVLSLLSFDPPTSSLVLPLVCDL